MRVYLRSGEVLAPGCDPVPGDVQIDLPDLHGRSWELRYHADGTPYAAAVGQISEGEVLRRRNEAMAAVVQAYPAPEADTFGPQAAGATAVLAGVYDPDGHSDVLASAGLSFIRTLADHRISVGIASGTLHEVMTEIATAIKAKAIAGAVALASIKATAEARIAALGDQ